MRRFVRPAAMIWILAAASTWTSAAPAHQPANQLRISPAMMDRPVGQTEISSLRNKADSDATRRTDADGDPFAAAAVFFLEGGGFDFLDETPDSFLFGESGQFAGNNVLSGVPVVISTASMDGPDDSESLQVSFFSEDGSDLLPVVVDRGEQLPNGSAQFDIGQEFALLRSGQDETDAGIQFTSDAPRQLAEVNVVLFRNGVPFLEMNEADINEFLGPDGLRWSVLLGDGETSPRGDDAGFFGLGIDEISIAFRVEPAMAPEPAAVPLLSPAGGAGLVALFGLAGATLAARRRRDD